MTKITKRAVEALDAGSGEVIAWDSELRGFGVRALPSGTKTFFIKFRNSQGRSRYLTIGRYGTLTAEQARQIARERLAEVVQGIDPLVSKRTERDAITVRELCAEYLIKCEQGLIFGRKGLPKKPGTLYTDKGRIERHIIPLLGSLAVKNVTAVNVRQFFEDVASGRTAADVKTGLHGRAIVKGGAGTARRTAGLLGGIFTYAAEKGYIAQNPVRGVKRGADGHRQFRLEADGWRAFGKCLSAAEAKGEHWQVLGIAKLLALTGARRDEICKLRWDEVDFPGRCIRFAPERLADGIKGGAVRPCGEPALTLLRRLHDTAARDATGRMESPYVFPGVRNQRKSFAGAFKRAWERLGLDYSPHALRHAFGSAAGDLQKSEVTVAALLGHAEGGSVTKGYMTKCDALLLAIADEVSGSVWAAIYGETLAGENVPLPMQRRAG